MTENYPQNVIAVLEAIWGEGFMSPGGPDEVASVLDGHDLTGASVLDIGCGAGGVDLAPARAQGASCVTGIDVEDGVLARARELVVASGLTDRSGLVRV